MGAGRAIKRPALFLLLAWAFIGLDQAEAKTSLRTSPSSVAQALFQSWRLKAPKSARAVATDEAVDKLFGVRWRAMKFEGCSQRDEGGFECVYRDRKNDLSLAMIVDGGASVGGYNVTSLSFSSES